MIKLLRFNEVKPPVMTKEWKGEDYSEDRYHPVTTFTTVAVNTVATISYQHCTGLVPCPLSLFTILVYSSLHGSLCKHEARHPCTGVVVAYLPPLPW